jgi:pimeloyl-ACP methyl ester carboxylesterase
LTQLAAGLEGVGGECAGRQDSPGLVLVHGTRMAGAYWRAQTLALAERFRVLAVDLPGHGCRREEPFTHEEAMRTITLAASSCAGGRAVVVGHSLGGFLAADAAASAPKRVRGLVLAGASADACGLQTIPFRLVLPVVALFSDERLTRWNDCGLSRLYPPEVMGPQQQAGYGFSAIAPAYRSIFGRDHAGALAADYPGPILLLNGERDRLFRRNEQRWLSRLPRARLAILPGAGHLSNWDAPEAFNAAVRAFIEGVGA